MLKMIIRMDEKKIHVEKKYCLEEMYGLLDHAFDEMGLPKIPDETGNLVYTDRGRSEDYANFGVLVNALKKQSWFMDNVTVWMLLDSDDSDDPDDFYEEDLLLHYRSKEKMRA